MKFSVDILPEAQNEIKVLEYCQQKSLEEDYKRIEKDGIEFVKVKHIQSRIEKTG